MSSRGLAAAADASRLAPSAIAAPVPLVAAAAADPSVISDVVLQFRRKHGSCHPCDTRIYQVKPPSDPNNKNNENNSNHNHNEEPQLTPLTVPGVVKLGRCLFCYPDRNFHPDNNHVAVPPPPQPPRPLAQQPVFILLTFPS